MTIINDIVRDTLNEGRSFGMGFAFCVKENGNNYRAVMPCSPCKDYLNDVVFTEKTGKSFEVYGFQHAKIDLFKNKKRCYLLFKIQPFKNGDLHSSYNEEVENLNSNYLNIQKFINKVEDLLKIKNKSKILKKDNDFIIVSDIIWAKYGYLISLLSGLVRYAQFYDGEKDIFDFLSNIKKPSYDVYNAVSTSKQLRRLIDRGNLELDIDIYKLEPGKRVHNMGILSVTI